MAICGIDFGTSNSTAGMILDGKPQLLPLEGDKTTLPSALFYDFEEETQHVGRAAVAAYVSGAEGRLLRSLKSVLGTSLMDATTEIFNRPIAFRQILATFFGDLKQRAEQAHGGPLTQAVLGRPVHFVDDDVAADRLAQQSLAEIAQAAGFREIAFQYEPIAAAFDYEQQVVREELALIIDIGGGTSDFSLIRLSPERHQRADRRDDILANGGVHIGGTDFDRLLSLAEIMPLLGLGGRMADKDAPVPSTYYHQLATWHTINFLYERKVKRELADVLGEVADRGRFQRLVRVVEERAGHLLAIAVERGKIEVCDAGAASLALDMVEDGLTLPLTLAQFEQSVSAAISRVDEAVNEVLVRAGLAPQAVDTLFFTGGASGVPLLRQTVLARFPEARAVEGDRFGSVGTGLAIAADRLFR
ncbi:Hsp70 family protein [Chitinivorax sp. PXF-14]|uniref:Hsp70 family protein n=1 Tax=Chitinivorax sp. PXF-14 TaxID=3230488 RepID=UPI00346742E3